MSIENPMCNESNSSTCFYREHLFVCAHLALPPPVQRADASKCQVWAVGLQSQHHLFAAVVVAVV